MKINKIKVGEIYLIQYEDATYSYIDLVKKRTPIPGLVSSTGMVRRIGDNFVDIVISWGEKSDKCFLGIIIPNKAIRKIKLLS